MLNKLEKAKILHQYDHYRLNAKAALKEDNTELAREYGIRLETMKSVLSNLELTAWEN
jgi:hypothetical protein